MKAAILIATYNEAENIKPLINQIFEITKRSDQEVYVVVVDDDSPDGTGQVLDRLQETYGDYLQIIHRKNERGCGSARRLGFKHCLRLPVDCIIEMDGDQSHNPEYLSLFIEFSRYYDVGIGSRYVEGGAVVGWPLKRKLISSTANAIYRLILGSKIHDLSGGYKCYRRRVIEALPFDEFHSTGYAIGIETLFRCYKLGFTFIEIPVIFHNRIHGSSKFSWKEAWEALRIIFFLVLRYGRANRLYDFERDVALNEKRSAVVTRPL
jgi:dolichol-phosphate mannosyltransferase